MNRFINLVMAALFLGMAYLLLSRDWFSFTLAAPFGVLGLICLSYVVWPARQPLARRS